MVVLAQALIGQPRYLLIDELSLGLAPVVVGLIPVIHTVTESGTGVLLIEQFATVALGLAHRAHITAAPPDGVVRLSAGAALGRGRGDPERRAQGLRRRKNLRRAGLSGAAEGTLVRAGREWRRQVHVVEAGERHDRPDAGDVAVESA